MTKHIFLLLAACSFLLTSCIETLEEIYLNKDGSGKYSVTFDMSEFFSNPMMKSMIEEAAKEEGAEGSFNLGETDTLIYFGESGMAEGVMKEAVMRMTMSDSLGKFMVSMNFPFENVGQISEFYQKLSEESAGAEAGPMGGMGSMLMPGGKFAFKKKRLSRMAADKEGAEGLFAGEDGEFMKMFFSGGTHTTVYHLPGKVKKTTIEGAEVEGNTVTVERPLMDLMEGKVGLEGEIRFKNR
ncbi:MAG: hypothetical protein KDD06_11945 [Phaeodactylibacter sp.]|nr:hypothetical protein [Phaeodactylibacter sp.]MCB9264711.1 hypothetical protein [Lewinellaceae bacterium]MCB9287078.1 hypothetical protein [Lewinellaceae bacterium]